MDDNFPMKNQGLGIHDLGKPRNIPKKIDVGKDLLKLCGNEHFLEAVWGVNFQVENEDLGILVIEKVRNRTNTVRL